MASKEGFGTWSMILGLIAIVLAIVGGGVGFIIPFCTCFVGPVGFFCAVAAIVLGIIALVAGKAKGKAWIGLICGVLYFFVYAILTVISWIVGMAVWSALD